MATPERDTIYTNDGNRTVYTRESNGTGWFVGIIVALALLAIGYLVFSANSGPSTTVDVNGAPAVEAPVTTDPAIAPAPMTEAPAATRPHQQPLKQLRPLKPLLLLSLLLLPMQLLRPSPAPKLQVLRPRSLPSRSSQPRFSQPGLLLCG
jgi:hypothetical protein